MKKYVLKYNWLTTPTLSLWGYIDGVVRYKGFSFLIELLYFFVKDNMLCNWKTYVILSFVLFVYTFVCRCCDKKVKNNDGKEFHQYLQYEHPPFTTIHWIKN